MIDITSASVGAFAGWCLGFIVGKLSSVNRTASAEMENIQLRYRICNLEEDLLLSQKERLNLAAKLAINKPKRDKHGRFIPKSKGKKS